MISSISLFGSSHLLTPKFYSKCCPNGLQYPLSMQSLTMFMGELLLASMGKGITLKKACFKPRALDIKKEIRVHDEENVFYKLGHKLPDSLSWLLASPEMGNRPTLKKKQPKEEVVTGHRFGVIMEWEGVVVEDDDPDLEPRVWYVLSLEEGKSFPPDEVLKNIEGMRADQAISEVLHWSEDPSEVQRLATRKEVIYQTLQGGHYQLRPGVLDFVNTLVDFAIPVAITTPRPRKALEEGIKAVGVQGYFDVTVAAEDFCQGKPEGEMFEVAAKRLSLEPDVCLVFGNSNLSTESAHAAGMRCVAVASRRPTYELRAADHVVRWLDQLSVVDLQRLADGDVIGHRGRGSDMDMEIVIEE